MHILEQFYEKWKTDLHSLLRSYTYVNKHRIRSRFVFLKLEKYLRKFLNDSLQEQEKIILLPGLRGVGKTTLLAQLYFFEEFLSKNNKSKNFKNRLDYKLYISVDELRLNNIHLHDFIQYLESTYWGSLVDGNKKILLLIDEIQYDEDWDLTLKTLYDKTHGKNNILIVATGSAAILLKKQNSDLIRRSIVQKIWPEKFIEYLAVHNGIYPEKGLSNDLKHAIFDSKTADEVYSAISTLKLPITAHITPSSDFEAFKRQYMLKGAMPFTAKLEDDREALYRIKEMLILNIIGRDLRVIGDFDSDTLLKIPDLLYLLANSDELSLSRLAQTLGFKAMQTLRKTLEALVDAELLYKVLPYGQPYRRVKKAPKYLFMAPALRNSLASVMNLNSIKGKSLEDYCALIFAKELEGKVSVMYDYGRIGADFIVRFRDATEIVIEIGYGKNTIRQVKETLKKTKDRAKYGLVIGSEYLELKDDNIVTIPLNYFLLM